LNRCKDADLTVYLLPARTDTVWFHKFCLPLAKEIRFIKGRLRFGDQVNPAPFPSMVVVFRKEEG
jgi:site-specific DNA-methyltransferase (adenine-specific)